MPQTVEQSGPHTGSGDPVPCPYCESRERKLVYAHMYHNKKADYGPFDILSCNGCGSMLTRPIPTAQQIRELYGSFSEGLPDDLFEARRNSPQTPWYAQCVKNLVSFGGERLNGNFSWLEIGPGSGNFTKQFADRFPASSGFAIDLHDCPDNLRCVRNVEWRAYDLEKGVPPDFIGRFDVVASIAVFEHVRDPAAFLGFMLQCLNSDGILYIFCPEYGLLVSRLMGRRWPYMLPGEHINIPTKKGARILVERELQNHGRQAKTVIVETVTVPYTLYYLAAYLKIQKLAAALPRHWHVPVPSGCLEIKARFHDAKSFATG